MSSPFPLPPPPHTHHIFIHTRTRCMASRANIHARNIRKRQKEGRRDRSSSDAVCFSFAERATLFAECSAAFHDTPIYFHRRCDTKRYIIPPVNVGATKGCWFSLYSLSLSAAASKFIICRRASSCRWRTCY
jgi:hypothetical protein